MTTKALFTLNIDDYVPAIRQLTFPLLKDYAAKIGAEFIVIQRRKFEGYPITYEKLQIHDLGRRYDWSIFFDADCLVHPDLFDITEFIGKDTVLQNSKDLANTRFRYDDYFRRDGRHIGACNWFTVASDWCLDLWRPLDDITLGEAISRIKTVPAEAAIGMDPSHLIDDFVLSRNIARFGLKHKTMLSLLDDLNRPSDEYFWHQYTLADADAKLAAMKQTLARWSL